MDVSRIRRLTARPCGLTARTADRTIESGIHETDGHSIRNSARPQEVVARIGAGGMGELYRATDSRFAARWRSKCCRPTVAADPQRLRRFEQEARAASAVNHPNVLVVHDIGGLDATPYLVTELLDGSVDSRAAERSRASSSTRLLADRFFGNIFRANPTPPGGTTTGCRLSLTPDPIEA
jgi:serine/threonine protein kinase